MWPLQTSSVSCGVGGDEWERSFMGSVPTCMHVCSRTLCTAVCFRGSCLSVHLCVPLYLNICQHMYVCSDGNYGRCAGVHSCVCPGLSLSITGKEISACVELCLNLSRLPYPQGLLSPPQFNLILSAVSLFPSSSPDVAIKQMQQLSRVPQTAIPPGPPSRN